MKKFITVSEYAEHRGVSRKQVYRYIHGGEITASSIRSGPRGALIDVQQADADLADYFGPRPEMDDDPCEPPQRETPADQRKALFRAFALAVCCATVDEMDRRHSLGLKMPGKLAIMRKILDQNPDVRGLISSLSKEKRRTLCL